MNNAAVISGSLVDAKNVNTHKVMRLIIDVPAENALKVIAAFGWPTMVNPVSVAVARLDERKVMPAETFDKPTTDTPPRLESNASAGADKPKKSPAQIAGYLCTTLPFQKFLKERFNRDWIKCMVYGVSPEDTADQDTACAAACIRELCKVDSRADITPDNVDWSALLLAFRLWENHPELEDA